MPHEVIKRVRGREYRYRVESYRDAATGKVRAHWTYLGRAGDQPAPLKRVPRSSEATRERLLDALVRLLDENDYADVTAGAIAAAAHLAHGTFYRHFSDKRAALVAAASRVRENFEVQRAALREPVSDRVTERERWRAWARMIISKPAETPGLLRAWYGLSAVDPQVAEARRERRAVVVGEIAAYLTRLVDADFSRVEPASAARAVTIVLEGAIRSAVSDREPVDGSTIEALVGLLDRSVFGDEPQALKTDARFVRD